MSEYRIVAGIDPQTAQGAAKVKQDLRGIQTEAKATETALNRSFDSGKFDKSLGGVTAKLVQLDKGLDTVSVSATQAGKSFTSTTGSLDRMTAAEFRAAGGLEGLNKTTKQTTQTQAQMEGALRRVLQATDSQSAEVVRLNKLLADSKRLFDAGMISQEQYARVQMMATNAGKQGVQVLSSQRMGMQQLGYQLGDVATMYSLGAKPAQIFGSQIGQITQAVQLMSGGTSKFANFIGGPWGIALSVGLIALTPLVAKIFEGNNALDDAVDKLRKDAQETEINRQAKEAYNRTLEGQIALQKELTKELDRSIQSQRQARFEGLVDAEKNLIILQRRKEDAEKDLETARGRLKEAEDALLNPPPGAGSEWGQAWANEAGKAEAEIQRLTDLLKAADKSIGGAQQNIRKALIPIQEDFAKSQVDPIAGINAQYDIMADKAKAAAIGNDQLSRALAGTLINIERQRAAALKQAEALKKVNEQAGVATFRSRAQAVGIAGRELQQSGLRVSENAQFGGIKGKHTTSHVNAIDINEGTGVVEANVPELKSKFDGLARRYAARGYKVLWNGQVYYPDGKIGPIPAGQNQHRDHMHLEAPATIIGKPTQSSTEAQAMREENQGARVQERAEDFVQGIVDRAATVGLSPDRKTQLASDIEAAFAEFKRRFERDPNFFEGWDIMTALTEADSRQIAKSFDDAYVKPLERLQALQGKTGLDRQILNAQLEETARIGGPLTKDQEALIENGIRQGDQQERYARLLEETRGPLEEYRAKIMTLNDALARGDISQAGFNARIGELNQAASQFAAGLPGNNAAGVPFAEQGARDEAELDKDIKLARLEEFLAQGTFLEEEAAAIRLGIWREYSNRMREIDDSRLDNARDFFGQLAGLQNSKVKEIAAIGKAAAITQATIDAYLAINKALATLPPPWNIAMAGAIGATALANVANIAGLKDGGMVRGPGGPRDDKVPLWGSNGEFMVNAKATQKNLPLLEAINAGADGRQVAAASHAAAPGGVAPGGASVVAVPAPQVHIRQINVVDPRMVADYFATPEGEQVYINLVNKFPEVVQRAAGTGRT